MSPCCFGVEPRADGSIVVAAQAASGWQRLAAYAAKSLHVWVIAAAGADLVRTAAWTRSSDPFD